MTSVIIINQRIPNKKLSEISFVLDTIARQNNLMAKNMRDFKKIHTIYHKSQILN